MKRHRLSNMLRPKKRAGVIILPGRNRMLCEGNVRTIKVIGWTSLAVGVAALGVYVGRELRLRYKFKRRTPYDFYAHSGDESAAPEYGMGI
jgi:hypothetical protein